MTDDACMTPAQFALAVGADARWVRNARRTLRRARRDDPLEAEWLGIVHELHASLGVALHSAARIADRVTGTPERHGSLAVATDPGGSITITIDVSRQRALHELRLACALRLPSFDHRGRPATSYRPIVADIARRARRESDHIRIALSARRPPHERLAALGAMSELLVELAHAKVSFLAIGEIAGALLGTLRQPSAVDVLHDANDLASLDALAGLLTQWRAAPRGADKSRSTAIAIEASIIGALPTLALDTDLGALNLWTRCHVIGDYATARHNALDAAVSGFPFPVLDLEALTAMERGKGQRQDAALLYELRQLGVERKRRSRLYSRSISRICGTTSVA